MDELILDNGKERGYALELALEKALAGWMTPGSGNKNIKGDVRSKLFCAEAKYRSSNDENGYFIAIDLQWIEAIWRTALKTRKTPLLALEFGSGLRVAVLPLASYDDMEGNTWQWDTVQRFNKPGRAPKIYQEELKTTSHSLIKILHLPDIEVDETEWVIIDWNELIYLRKLNQEAKRKIKFR